MTRNHEPPISPLRRQASWLSLLISLLLCALLLTYAWYARRQMLDEQYRAELYLTTLNNLVGVPLIVSAEGKILDWGEGAEKLFGWTRQEVLGSSLDFMLPDEYQDQHRQLFSRPPAADDFAKVHLIDCVALTRSGKRVPVHIRIRLAKHQSSHRFWIMIDALEDLEILNRLQERNLHFTPRQPQPDPQVLQRAS